MSNSLQTLEPKLLWKHFGDICAIPHPSKHEQQIAQHLRDWAKEHGFETVVDAVGSMVIQVPATPGHEGSPTVVLQGHMDMVCEKNSDVQHDCVNDPIKVKVDGDWVKAEGTTLGADNGVGLAAAMAIAEDSDSAHGPLELLCTVDEETGLTGAKQLDPSLINGRILLNLDTEEDGAIYIGCAGGADSEAVIGFSRRKGLLGSVPVTGRGPGPAWRSLGAQHHREPGQRDQAGGSATVCRDRGRHRGRPCLPRWRLQAQRDPARVLCCLSRT
jgi:dipeptidase D